MRWLTCFALLIGFSLDLSAHQPDHENRRVWPRIDLIPPLGVWMDAGYARLYNRPARRTGWLAYQLAPTSREAMAWHEASHQQAYKLDRGRLEKHYFYQKPWEGIQMGPRPETVSTENTIQPIPSDDLRKAIRMEEQKLSNPQSE